MPDIVDQYRIIANGAGWRRRTDRGRILFEGADRLAFLQALVTNDVGRLASGQGAYAAYLTPAGRMITDLHVYQRDLDTVADVPAAHASRLVTAFDQLIFSEDVRVADATSTLAQFSVTGGHAADAVAQACGLDAARLRAFQAFENLGSGDVLLARTDDAVLDTFDVFVPAAEDARIVHLLEGAGAMPMSDALVEALRIDAGRPAFGRDMDEDTIPLEAGLLDRAISTTKGCYVGQEIVIRVLHRGGGRVAKRLVKLSLGIAGPPVPAVGTPISVDGHDVGRLTSVAVSPHGTGVIALGYVHRDAAEAGRVVRVGTDPGTDATIVGFAS